MIDDLIRNLHLLQKADSVIGKIWFNVIASIASSLRTQDQPEFGLCDGNIFRTFAERNRSLRSNLPKFVGICSA